jgi:hypothetical protein
MRDYQTKKAVTTPKWMLKPELREIAKKGWQKWGTPIDEWTEEQWGELGYER